MVAGCYGQGLHMGWSTLEWVITGFTTGLLGLLRYSAAIWVQ
jgi:hypothetical protein